MDVVNRRRMDEVQMKNELLHNLGKPTELITPHGEVGVKSPKCKEYKLTYSATHLSIEQEIIFIDYGDGKEVVGMIIGRGGITQSSREYARDTWNECIKKGYKVVK